MSTAVQVVVVGAAALDGDIIRAHIGTAPLPVEPAPGAAILVDGRFHTAACRWLAYRSAGRRATTVKENAKHLAAWIIYLRAVRGHDDPDEAHADVFAATEDDLLAYRAHLQHRVGQEQVGPAAWAARLSTIKQFHEYASRRWGLPMPFTLTTAYTAHGATVMTTGLSPRVKQGSVGSPLDPVYAEQLVQGAWRIDADGEEHGDERVQRDAAFINLGLGTGARRRSLAGITIHELPPPRETLFNTLRVADLAPCHADDHEHPAHDDRAGADGGNRCVTRDRDEGGERDAGRWRALQPKRPPDHLHPFELTGVHRSVDLVPSHQKLFGGREPEPDHNVYQPSPHLPHRGPLNDRSASSP